MPLESKIAALRKEKGWSQDKLSKAIEISPKHISRYENGKSIPGAEPLKKLADVFGVTTDYLLYDNVPRDTGIKFKDPELVRQMEQIESLDDDDRNAIKKVIQAMIVKKRLSGLVETATH